MILSQFLIDRKRERTVSVRENRKQGDIIKTSSLSRFSFQSLRRNMEYYIKRIDVAQWTRGKKKKKEKNDAPILLLFA